jgi:hypothetical protein
MKLGDIVYLKQYPAMIGEVVGINDMDIITVSLCDTRLKITVAMCDLGITESLQPNRYPSSVNILGVKYKIIILSEDDYLYDKDTDGWCDPFAKEILLYNYKQSVDSVKDLKAYQKKVLRHEIVHAFLYESGLWQNSHSSTCWAKNEEMVDWLAIQEPKLHRAFKEAGCDE